MVERISIRNLKRGKRCLRNGANVIYAMGQLLLAERGKCDLCNGANAICPYVIFHNGRYPRWILSGTVSFSVAAVISMVYRAEKISGKISCTL